MKKSISKSLAFAFACLLGLGGLGGMSSFFAMDAVEVQAEPSTIEIDTNQEKTTYTSGAITVTVVNEGDEDGVSLSGGDTMTIKTSDGSLIDTVVFTIGFYWGNVDDLRLSSGTFGDKQPIGDRGTVTYVDINNKKVVCNTTGSLLQNKHLSITTKLSETKTVEINTNQGQTSYTKDGLTVTATDKGDGDGALIVGSDTMTITAPDEMAISKIVFTIGYYWDLYGGTNLRVTSGTCDSRQGTGDNGGLITYTGINSEEVVCSVTTAALKIKHLSIVMGPYSNVTYHLNGGNIEGNYSTIYVDNQGMTLH